MSLQSHDDRSAEQCKHAQTLAEYVISRGVSADGGLGQHAVLEHVSEVRCGHSRERENLSLAEPLASAHGFRISGFRVES
jgi:hypothetical protein